MARFLKRFLLTLIILLSVFAPAGAQGHEPDKNWTVTERRIYAECQSALSLRRYDDLTVCASRLETESAKSDNPDARDIGIALRLRGNVSRHGDHPNNKDADYLELSLKQSETSGKKEHDNTRLFSIYMALGFYYLYDNLDFSKAADFSFKALETAEEISSDRMRVDALNLLGAIYALKSRPEGIQYVIKSEELSRKDNNPSGRYASLVNLASYLFNDGKSEKALAYLNEARRLASDMQMDGETVYLESFLGDVWSKLGNAAKAENHYRKSLSPQPEASYYDKGYARLCYSIFLADQKRYDEALKMTQSAMGVLKGHKEVNYSSYLMLHLAEIYERLGLYPEALEAYKDYSGLHSRQITAEKEKEFSILQLKYEISEHENREKEQMLENARRERRYTVILFLCVILTITAAFMTAVYTRSRRQYRRTIAANFKVLEKEREENRRLTESIRKSNLKKEESQEKNDKREEELYGRLLILMENEKPYRDSSLSIEKTAAMLNTNRTYLSQVINGKGGCSYSVFVNKFRIDEAVRLLITPGNDMSIKEVALSVGFASMPYFNSLFKQMMGVSPGVFRTQGAKSMRRPDEQNDSLNHN